MQQYVKYLKWIALPLFFLSLIYLQTKGVRGALFSLLPLAIFITIWTWDAHLASQKADEVEDDEKVIEEPASKTSTDVQNKHPQEKTQSSNAINMESSQIDKNRLDSNGIHVSSKQTAGPKSDKIVFKRSGEEKSFLLASKEGNLDMVELLLKDGIDPDTSNSKGITALMFAVKFNNIDIVELLLASGADANLTSETGLCALNIAKNIDNKEILKLLYSYGAQEPS